MRTIRGAIFLGCLFTTTLRAAGLPPDESLARLKPADGLSVQLVASEPLIRQPVEAHFDARGRLWVVQYIQYPHPAGAVATAVDPYLRTRYNISPLPPPYGPVGADKITILEDQDEKTGRYRKGKDFVTGLNLATSVEWGYGGVWVMNPPYLLFYADRDRDDVPDGPPEVKLAGFVTEDTHAVASHLTWGPDGWLYGCQGSTCTAHVRGLEFQQAAWRYHPVTKRFEVFAEGGGNTFGLEWDQHGNLLTGTNYAHFVMVHYVQGGYFVKGFTKHGPLSNPYAFGYFDHVPHTGWRGGHVTQLGVLYQGGALPSQYDGRWIAPNVLTSTIDAHEVRADGSTFTTSFAGEVVGSSDSAFRPVDIRTGPDGALYVADWYDKRANHVIPEDTWDKETGRVYRIASKDAPFAAPFDLEKKTSAELVRLLDDRNDWYARMSRRILAERRDASVVPMLQAMLRENEGRLALQALWALHVSGGLDEAAATESLAHRNSDVRAWTVRLLADDKQIAAPLRQPLVDLARSERTAVVRAQLACSARRLPVNEALPILRELMLHDDDATDRYIPLLIWWALEAQVSMSPADVAHLFQSPKVRESAIATRFLLERLAHRFTAGGSSMELSACGELLDGSLGAEQRQRVLAGMNEGLDGKPPPAALPPALRDALVAQWQTQPVGAALVCVSTRLGVANALDEAVRRVGAAQTPDADRIALIGALADAGGPAARDALLGLIDPSNATAKPVVRSALIALARFDDSLIAPAVVKAYPRLAADARPAAAALLVARPASAAALLDAVAAGSIKPDDVPAVQARRVLAFHDAKLDALVARFWQLRTASDDEKAQSIGRITKILKTATTQDSGAARGKIVFTKTCAACHAFRGQGARIGPDLTGFGKANLDYLIRNIVDPSALIRPEYASYILRTTDGETFSGMTSEAPSAVTILEGETRTVIPRERIAKLEQSTVSPMPEKLLDAMTPQEVRDLFAFLLSER